MGLLVDFEMFWKVLFKLRFPRGKLWLFIGGEIPSVWYREVIESSRLLPRVEYDRPPCPDKAKRALVVG